MEWSENALAVVELGGKSSSKGRKEESEVIGFIPTGAYPGAICLVKRKLLFVANIEGEGARVADFSIISGGEPAYNAHKMKASVSRIPVPGKEKLASYSEKVAIANQLFRIESHAAKTKRRHGSITSPRRRIGEPSVFKHVVYIIKENKTYDQVLGDMPEGEGEPELCVFGEEITPIHIA